MEIGPGTANGHSDFQRLYQLGMRLPVQPLIQAMKCLGPVLVLFGNLFPGIAGELPVPPNDYDLRLELAPPPTGTLPELDESRLLSGKNNFFIDPQADPAIANNNFRLLLKRKTGMVLAEEEVQ